MAEIRCTMCGEVNLEQGFMEDRGDNTKGYIRWIEGALRLGVFGGAKRMGLPRRAIEAYRCPTCSHLELFATSQQ